MATGSDFSNFDFSNIGSMFGGMQGGTPTGLDALLNEDQRKLMNRNAALSAAAALLQASGRSTTPIGLGQALGSALQAGQQGYQQARAGSVQDLVLGEKLKEAQDERQRNVDYFEMLKRAGQPAPPMQQAPLTGVAVPPVERFVSETMPVAAPAATGPLAGLSQQQLALMRGLPREKGLQFALDAMKPQKTVGQPFEGRDGKFYLMTETGGVIPAPIAPALKAEETVGQPFKGQDGNFYIQTKTGKVIPAPVAPAAKPTGAPQQMMGAGGKPVMVQNYDDGTYQIVSGVSPLITPQQLDTGTGVRFVDPFSIPTGTVFPKGLAPQVVGNPEDGYFLVGGGAGGVSRPSGAAPAAGAAPAPAAPAAPAAGAAPATAGPVPLIPGTGKAFAREKDLRSTYTKEMEPFVDLGQAFKKVEAAALNPSAAGDISMVYGYMKILDPRSTVMQGEQATATNAGSVPERVRAQYNKALTGQGLLPEIRQDFYAQARNLIESQRQLQQDISERYKNIATQNKLDSNQIVFDPFQRIKTPAQIAADAARVAEDEKKKPKSFFDTYNLLKRN